MKTDHVVALIASIREKANRYLTQELRRRRIQGLAPSHGSILSTLLALGPVSMQELAGRIDRDKSTVTVLVEKLRELGYVEKRKAREDARVTLVALTPEGLALGPVFSRISRKLIARAFAGFEPRQKEALVRGLERMLRNW